MLVVESVRVDWVVVLCVESCVVAVGCGRVLKLSDVVLGKVHWSCCRGVGSNIIISFTLAARSLLLCL